MIDLTQFMPKDMHLQLALEGGGHINTHITLQMEEDGREFIFASDDDSNNVFVLELFSQELGEEDRAMLTYAEVEDNELAERLFSRYKKEMGYTV